MWILYFIFPATIVTHDPATMRDSQPLAGVQVMSFLGSYPSHEDCVEAGKLRVSTAWRATPGSFYVCAKGEVVR